MFSIDVKQLPTLIRREFWEHRWAFIYAPLIVCGLGILLFLMAIIFGMKADGSQLFTHSAIREFAELSSEARTQFLRAGMLSNTINFNGLLQIVMFFYLVSALYDERKDRSILFWKSLPISDTTTVVSKLLTAGIAVPVIYMLVAAGIQLVSLLIAAIYASQAGVGVWETVLQPSGLLSVWLNTLIAIPVQFLWILPLYAWFVLVSAFAPRLPWLLALIIPGLIGLFQNYFSLLESLRLADKNLWVVLWERIYYGIIGNSVNFKALDGKEYDSIEDFFENTIFDINFGIGDILSRFADPSMWIGIVIGVVFIALAIKLRARASDY